MHHYDEKLCYVGIPIPRSIDYMYKHTITSGSSKATIGEWENLVGCNGKIYVHSGQRYSLFVTFFPMKEPQPTHL